MNTGKTSRWDMLRSVPIFFATLLAACGGGSGSDNQIIPPGALTQGIWRGTIAIDGLNLGLLVGMVDDRGKANLILYSGNSQLRGEISCVGAEFNKSSSYLSEFDYWGDLGRIYSSISGTVSAGSTLSATLVSVTTTGSNTLSLDLHYDVLYTRPSSLSAIAGHWHYNDSIYAIDWQIAASGTFTGTDTKGCIYAGQVSIANAAYNLYRMDYQITGCYNIAVNVSGLAILDDSISANDTLLSAGTGKVAVLNTDSFVERLIRQ